MSFPSTRARSSQEDPHQQGQFYITPLEAAILLVLDYALQLPPLDRRHFLLTTVQVLKDVAKDDGFLIESAS